MGLSSSLITTQSALTTLSAETAVVSRNISGVNTSGFSRKVANIATTVGGGVQLTSITNTQNSALFESMLSATASSSAQSALSAGLTTLQNTIGSTSSATSPASQISALTNALQQYEASPNDSSLASSVITAASSLATTLNNATNMVQQLREQTDQKMSASVTTINTLLTQFQTVNSQIIQGTAANSDTTDLIDLRNSILSQLSQQVGISTVSGANGDMSIYTDSGVTLFQGGQPSSVTFQPTSAYGASTTGNAVYIDGIPVTGSSATMPIQSGALAGLANLRDNVTVTYQAQLDQTAQGLINAYAETDPSGSGTVLAGLFTNAGSTTLPTMGSDTGLAGTISLNAAVDPTQGGTPSLLRDGINFTFNTTGAASYSTQLQQLLTNVSASQTFDPAAQLSTSTSVTSYANASAAWLEAQRQNASTESTYQSTLLSNSTTALSNATGVNLNDEMSKMLDLENSYSATAKLLTTVNTMFSDLTAAINPSVLG